MGTVSRNLRLAAAALALLAAASCSAVPDSPGRGSAGPAITRPVSTRPASIPRDSTAPDNGPSTAAAGTGPLTAQINQFRDNYSRQIIEIQLTNTTGEAVTVLAAEVRSPLYESGISWTAAGAGTELPSGQTKSLPARLPAASCPGLPSSRQPSPGQPSSSWPPEGNPVVRIHIAAAARRGDSFTAPAADPFGVLGRNNAEMCVAQGADRLAGFRLDPELEVSADGRSAVVRLVITPRNPAGAAGGAAGSLTIDSVDGTTLLEEDPGAPWPRGLRVDAAGPEQVLPLGIRPARCDPHAVAEDKVGTLIPLRVTVAGRQGVLKVDAGALLRGRIYDFVTGACGRQ